MNVPATLAVMDIAKIVTHTINAAGDYLKTLEIEKTERQRVIACLNAISAKLESERKKFERFMEKSFSERERLYKTFDKLIEKGLQTDDMELLKLASNCMINIYQKNPLSGLNDVLQQVDTGALNQPQKKYID